MTQDQKLALEEIQKEFNSTIYFMREFSRANKRGTMSVDDISEALVKITEMLMPTVVKIEDLSAQCAK